MAAARMGKGPFFDPSKLTLYNGEKVISYRIEVQDGRAFAGVIGTGDKEAPVTGVFQLDGKNFIFSDSFGPASPPWTEQESNCAGPTACRTTSQPPATARSRGGLRPRTAQGRT
ncbi:hypothetical protein, partial [Xanthobacter flavus]